MKYTFGFVGWLLTSLTFALMVACAPSEPIQDVQKIVIYYRSLDGLRPVQFTEADLVRSGDFGLEVTDKPSIRTILNLMNGPCISVDAAPSRIDTYLIIKSYTGNALTRSWKSSRLMFFDSHSGKTCRLGADKREELNKTMLGLEEMAKRDKTGISFISGPE